MTDYFALLKEPRRPWGDPDALKQKFLALSAESHPDRVHAASEAEKRAAQQCYTDLNAAYNCLRDPKERLRHLLELERGARPRQVENIPPDLMNLFLKISEVCGQADKFLAERASVTSPLLKVGMFERSQQLTDELRARQTQVNSQCDQLMSELKVLDAGWEANGNSESPSRTARLQRLEELYRLFGYFARWRGQLQERIVQLSF